MLLTMSQEELANYVEDRKLIEFRLTTMENAIIKLADTVHEYINSNDRITTELKIKVAVAAGFVSIVVTALTTVLVKLLWK